MAAFATAAQAFPTRTSACTGCHSGANIPVTATLASTVGTNATYNFSATGADSVAVFDGSTKIFTFLAPTGQFTVAAGKTYTIYAVGGPSTSDGIGSTTVSPVIAPPADTTAPVTSSNAVASYISNATITLSATDAGSGVAATYYKLDGGAQVAGTSISVSALGSHTIEFWSVDVAGNAEVHKTASFTISAPAPVDTTAPVTSSNAVASYISNATITLSATDAGSGVAATYYKLDGGAQVAGTSISVSALGSHTIEFWSVDVAGNAEVHKTASFTISAPAPAPTGTYTVKTRVSSWNTRGRTATLTDTTSGAKYTAIVGKAGVVVFTEVPAGTYRLSVSLKKGEKYVRTIVVAAPAPSHDDDDDDSYRTSFSRHLLRD
jgi:predicted transporter